MARDTTVQFRMDSEVKDAAFSVFHEMGITPSEAVRVFFKQVQKTRTIPFVLHTGDTDVAVEPGYREWLQERLARVTQGMDSGAIPLHSPEEARLVLKEKRRVLREKRKSSLSVTL